MNIEQGTFTPLIFSINGGEGAESLAFHRHIAEKIAQGMEDRFKTCDHMDPHKIIFPYIESRFNVYKRKP